MGPIPEVTEHPPTTTLGPPVANPQLSFSAIRAQARTKRSWLYGYLFDPNEFVMVEHFRDPNAHKTAGELIAHMREYQKSVIQKTGLPDNSWVQYDKRNGQPRDILVLGTGFDRVLHRPLKGVVQRAKEALGREDEPQWYLFHDWRR